MAEPKKLENGKYLIRVRVQHPFSKKWIERQGTFRTKKECRDFEVDVKSRAKNLINPDRIKLAAFFDLWYETFQEPKNLSRDHIAKINLTKRYLLDFFGKDFLLADLNKFNYQKWVNHLAKQKAYSNTKNRKSTQTLALATVMDYHKICKSMLIEAIDNGYIQVNPTRNVVITGRDTSGEKKMTITPDEWKKLLKVVLEAENSSSKFAALTAMFLGTRFQEVIGLRTTDLKYKEKYVSITKAFDYKKTKKYTPTKNKHSVRNIDAPDILFDILRPWIKEIDKPEQIVDISEGLKGSYLFPNDIGIPITNNAVNKFIRKCCIRAGIPRVTSHAFRHCKTDLLVLAGADMIYTQKQLGHADPATTLKYYSSLNNEIRNKNKAIQDNFLQELSGM